MIFAAYGSVSDIEILWTLIAVVGLSFSAYNLVDARGDLEYIYSEDIHNGRTFLARTNFVAEMTRVIKQGIFLAIGLMAMFVPEVPNTLDLPRFQSVIRFTITWGLIIASALTSYQSYLGFKVRRALKD